MKKISSRINHPPNSTDVKNPEKVSYQHTVSHTVARPAAATRPQAVSPRLRPGDLADGELIWWICHGELAMVDEVKVNPWWIIGCGVAK